MDFAEGEARAEVSPFPREPRRRPNFSRASSGSAWPPKNETLARFARARGERAKWPAGGWLPPGGLVSNTLKWPSWAWLAVRSPYQTRPLSLLSFGSLPPPGILSSAVTRYLSFCCMCRYMVLYIYSLSLISTSEKLLCHKFCIEGDRSVICHSHRVLRIRLRHLFRQAWCWPTMHQVKITEMGFTICLL
jgi:hypothetical protein